jgi:uncharacterized protein
MTRIGTKLAWLLVALTLGTTLAQSASDIQGRWEGALVAGPATLRLVLEIKGSAGAYTGTLTSVDQGNAVIPINAIAVEGGTLRLDVAAVMGKYEGKVADDGKKIAGTWTQAGMSLPLEFTRMP